VTTRPEAQVAQEKIQKQVLAGVMLVMAGVVFGGGVAMALYFVGQRAGAGAAAIAGGVFVLAGAWMQAAGMMKLNAMKKVGKG
jgi:hypothetical protein